MPCIALVARIGAPETQVQANENGADSFEPAPFVINQNAFVTMLKEVNST